MLDPLGREEEEIEANTATQNWVLNAGGLPVFYTDPLGNSTQYQYAATPTLAGDDLEQVTNPDGSYTKFTYNTTYNELSEIDQSVVANTPADDELSYIYYDMNGNVTATLDGNGDETQYAYGTGGSTGLVTSMTDADGNTTTFSYDVGSGSGSTRRLLSMTDPMGIVTDFGYDGNGNVLTTTVQATSSLAGVANSPAVTVTTIYDARGQLLSATTPAVVGGVSSSDTTTTQYTASGLAAATQNANGYWTDYMYDQRGFLTQLVSSGGAAGSVGHQLWL